MPVSENLNETRSFNQRNFIDVSTQNNFCGYYVLARRLINDNNYNSLLDKFNTFYHTSWEKEQLAQVLANMHPAQAEIMLGLVLQAPYPNRNQGLEIYELGKLCKKFGYNLFIAQQEHLPESIDSSSFNSQGYLPEGKKILVLFTSTGVVSELGHYYLVEPDNTKAALDANLRNDPNYEATYAINNEGSNTEFIENIKQSVTSINNENFVWKTALEEARITEEKLKSFKQSLFFKQSDLRDYLLDLQTERIKYYEEKKLQSECIRASQKKA